MEQAEARAEFAERSVQKLQKEVDRLEGMKLCPFLLLYIYNSFKSPLLFYSEKTFCLSLKVNFQNYVHVKFIQQSILISLIFFI